MRLRGCMGARESGRVRGYLLHVCEYALAGPVRLLRIKLNPFVQ